MQLIFTSIVLLVLISSTLQKPKIGRFCPEAVRMKEEFADMCIEITCRPKKLLSSNFKIAWGRKLQGLHERFHEVYTCYSTCPSGFVSVSTDRKAMALMYPMCCQHHVCVNTLNILQRLSSNDRYLND